jgi:hypothetical protein
MRMTQHHLHLCAWLVVVLSLASVVWNSRAVGSLKITSLTIFWCAFHHVSPFGCWPSSFSELLHQHCSGVNVHSSLCAIDVAKVFVDPLNLLRDMELPIDSIRSVGQNGRKLFHHVSPFRCWPSSFSELLCQRCSGVNIHSSLCAIDVAKVLLILSTCSVTRNCPLTASGAWAKMAKNVCGFPQRPTVPPLPQKKVRATPASRATLQTSMVRSARST